MSMETKSPVNNQDNHFLQTLTSIIEKQEALTKITAKALLHEYSFSEIHCIEMIGQLDRPNVTKIAGKMGMTRSGISKIITRLKKKGCISSYQEKVNKKEIYYQLTELGIELDAEHETRHSNWIKRDKTFLVTKSQEELKAITNFLLEYDCFLKDCIENLSKIKE